MDEAQWRYGYLRMMTEHFYGQALTCTVLIVVVDGWYRWIWAVYAAFLVLVAVPRTLRMAKEANRV